MCFYLTSKYQVCNDVKNEGPSLINCCISTFTAAYLFKYPLECSIWTVFVPVRSAWSTLCRHASVAPHIKKNSLKTVPSHRLWKFSPTNPDTSNRSEYNLRVLGIDSWDPHAHRRSRLRGGEARHDGVRQDVRRPRLQLRHMDAAQTGIFRWLRSSASQSTPSSPDNCLVGSSDRCGYTNCLIVAVCKHPLWFFREGPKASLSPPTTVFRQMFSLLKIHAFEIRPFQTAFSSGGSNSCFLLKDEVNWLPRLIRVCLQSRLENIRRKISKASKY